jgi:hypothetical protein
VLDGNFFPDLSSFLSYLKSPVSFIWLWLRYRIVYLNSCM